MSAYAVQVSLTGEPDHANAMARRVRALDARKNDRSIGLHNMRAMAAQTFRGAELNVWLSAIESALQTERNRAVST